MKSSSRYFFRLMAAVGCLFFVYFMGVNNLKNVPLANHDENRTLIHVLSPFLDSPQSLQATIASVANHSEQHGPMYFVLLNVWSRLTGDDLFTLRLLSTYFGLLTIAMVYRLAMLSRDGHLGLAAVFMLALNWLFLFYTRELRMYTLLPAITSLIVWSYWRLIQTPGRRPWWIWLFFVASSGLVLYVHYFGIFILAAVGVYHLLFVHKDRHWIQVTVAMITGGMLFLPWLPTVIKGLSLYTQKSFVGMTAGESIIKIASVYSNDSWFIPVGCVLLIVWNRKRLNEFQRFLLILLFLSIAILMLVNEFTPIFLSKRLRYTLVFAPMLVCSLAIGWRFLSKHNYIQLLMIGVWLLAFITYYQNEGSYIAVKRKSLETRSAPPFSIVQRSDIEIAPSEPILSLHPSRKITYITGEYYQRLLNPASLVHLYYNGSGSLEIQATKKELNSLDQFVAEYASFWLLYNPQETAPQAMSQVFNWMYNYYRSCGRTVDESQAVIERFVRDSDPC